MGRDCYRTIAYLYRHSRVRGNDGNKGRELTWIDRIDRILGSAADEFPWNGKTCPPDKNILLILSIHVNSNAAFAKRLAPGP